MNKQGERRFLEKCREQLEKSVELEKEDKISYEEDEEFLDGMVVF